MADADTIEQLRADLAAVTAKRAAHVCNDTELDELRTKLEVAAYDRDDAKDEAFVADGRARKAEADRDTLKAELAAATAGDDWRGEALRTRTELAELKGRHDELHDQRHEEARKCDRLAAELAAEREGCELRADERDSALARVAAWEPVVRLSVEIMRLHGGLDERPAGAPEGRALRRVGWEAWADAFGGVSEQWQAAVRALPVEHRPDGKETT